MIFPKKNMARSTAIALLAPVLGIVAALALSASPGSPTSSTTAKSKTAKSTTVKTAAKTSIATTKRPVGKASVKTTAKKTAAKAPAKSATVITTRLTWPALKKSRTYTVRVPVDGTRTVDFYATSVSLGGPYSLSPGFEQTYSCAKGRTKAAVEFYEGTATQITMELTVKNGGCSPVAGKSGAVPVQARITVRYDTLPRPQADDSSLPLDP